MCINRTKNLVLKLNKTQIIINQKIKKLINGQTPLEVISDLVKCSYSSEIESIGIKKAHIKPNNINMIKAIL